jgi:hypothetical protein
VNLMQKIVVVAQGVEKMRKDGSNTHHKYKFFSHGLVTATVRDLMLEQGLVTHVTMKDGSCVVRIFNADPLLTVEGKVIQQTNGAPLHEMIESTFDIPRPNDQAQSTGAIVSYAVKTMYQKTFMLEDVETPDPETMAPKNKPAEKQSFEVQLQLVTDASSLEELSAAVKDLDQASFSKDQWNQLSTTYKERLKTMKEKK